MNRIYICGPNPEENALAAKKLRDAGHDAIEPLATSDLFAGLAASLSLLRTCDAVALMPGYSDDFNSMSVVVVAGRLKKAAELSSKEFQVEELDWYVEDPDALRSSAQVWTGDLVSLDIGDESMGLSARNAVVDDVIWDAAGAGMTGLRLSIDGEPLAIVYVPEDAPIIRVEMRGDR